jgi:hypothetical protein
MNTYSAFCVTYSYRGFGCGCDYGFAAVEDAEDVSYEKARELGLAYQREHPSTKVLLIQKLMQFAPGEPVCSTYEKPPPPADEKPKKKRKKK